MARRRQEGLHNGVDGAELTSSLRSRKRLYGKLLAQQWAAIGSQRRCAEPG